MQNSKFVPNPLKRSQNPSLNKLGWKGPEEVSSPTSCTKQDQFWLLPCQVLKAPKDTDRKSLQATCCTAWLSYTTMSYLVSKQEPLCFPSVFTTFSPPWRPWLCLLNTLSIGTSRLLYGPLSPSPLQAEPAQSFLRGQVLQLPTTTAALCWTHAGFSMTVLYWGTKTGTEF